MSRGLLVLGALVVTLCAGCAGAPGSLAVDPTLSGAAAGTASPPTLQVPRCRNAGVYNRAANLCVSEGP
jgi:hypothetical protein